MKDFFNKRMKDNRILIDGNQTAVVFKNVPQFDVFSIYFEIDNRKFYFKSNSKYSLDVSELLSYALDNAVHKNAVPAYPATFYKDGKEYLGTLTEDVLQNNKSDELISGADLLNTFLDTSSLDQSGLRKERFNTIEHYKNAVMLLLADKNNVLDERFFIDLAKHMITGFIRSDEDMHSHNIPIIISQLPDGKKLFKIGKLFDNSMSFLLKSHRSKLRESFKDLSNQEKHIAVEKALDDVGFPFQVQLTSNRQTGRQFISKEIAGLILKYPELKKYYNAYKKLDIRKTFYDFKQENNYDFINDSDIELASMVVKNSCKMLDYAIEFKKMQQLGPMKLLSQSKDDPDLEF